MAISQKNDDKKAYDHNDFGRLVKSFAGILDRCSMKFIFPASSDQIRVRHEFGLDHFRACHENGQKGDFDATALPQRTNSDGCSPSPQNGVYLGATASGQNNPGQVIFGGL